MEPAGPARELATNAANGNDTEELELDDFYDHQA